MALWEREQEDLAGAYLLSGVSKSELNDAVGRGEMELTDAQIAATALRDLEYYHPHSPSVIYTEGELQIAMELAERSFSPLSYVGIDSRDREWDGDSSTIVQRYILKDGSVGYFKPLRENSRSEPLFSRRGLSSLGAATNEVNGHRMAKLLGGGFENLVPETVLREVNGELGTLQREVPRDRAVLADFRSSEELRDDYRKAAIFDFVIGSVDRHSGNYLYGIELSESGEPRSRIRLIDNSYSFVVGPMAEGGYSESLFSDNNGTDLGWNAAEKVPVPGYRQNKEDLELKDDERDSLKAARTGVESWAHSGTIDPERASATIRRIDYLLMRDRIGSLGAYLYDEEDDDED